MISCAHGSRKHRAPHARTCGQTVRATGEGYNTHGSSSPLRACAEDLKQFVLYLSVFFWRVSDSDAGSTRRWLFADFWERKTKKEKHLHT